MLTTCTCRPRAAACTPRFPVGTHACWPSPRAALRSRATPRPRHTAIHGNSSGVIGKVASLDGADQLGQLGGDDGLVQTFELVGDHQRHELVQLVLDLLPIRRTTARIVNSENAKNQSSEKRGIPRNAHSPRVHRDRLAELFVRDVGTSRLLAELAARRLDERFAGYRFLRPG